MNNTNQTFQQQVQTKLIRFNTLLTKAIQQHNPTLFNLSVGTLLEIQDLMFPINQTTSTEASTELISETSSVDTTIDQTTDQTTEPNPTKEESD